MGVTVLVCVLLGALVGIGTLYYLARQNSVSSRERAIQEARKPLERELATMQSDLADLKAENRDLRKRCDSLEDELRRRR